MLTYYTAYIENVKMIDDVPWMLYEQKGKENNEVNQWTFLTILYCIVDFFKEKIMIWSLCFNIVYVLWNGQTGIITYLTSDLIGYSSSDICHGIIKTARSVLLTFEIYLF